MKLANEVSKRGFRRWYERQLIESHLYLVTCFLCAFLLFACAEAMNFRESAARGILMVLLGAASGVVALAAWQRYAVTMVRAQRLAEKATCAKCDTYGILRVTDASRIVHPVYDHRGVRSADDANAVWLRVECKRCGYQWSI